MNVLSHAHNYLLQHLIKPSVQRTAIMFYLLENRTHPTVDEIYTALSPRMPTLSKTTVYNTLGLFVERGAVRVLTLDERNARYDVDTTKHAHFFCKSCGKVFNLMDIDMEVFNLPQHDNFKIDSVEISYSGFCLNCQ